ncbi:phospholipid/cholesterol/gamma-HCH transport system substrate-binding protein [Amycolatopsis xylanica]|uniref:Phospholipid/cholesterol/gamma-HCH transport system substrate-binding protein n=1 Tax=Amycolatopsis xylanica TaxID=589385 RepID=A0A1H3Q390_9PSEU|nr:MCE family protein [Amycolatopsis xylanica]SDZ07199.1 phospholipid/cholesterol/gamma-HCH transport system substrate-binding protein [Amycolatopsis xylanica]
MKPLKQRNQAAVGGVTLVLLTLVVIATYFSDRIPLFGNGTTYAAYFAESAGLAPENEVEVAGVKVGQVTSVSLAGKKVLVKFRVKDTRVGDTSTASIEIKTLLGEKYLALRSSGAGNQDPNVAIPVQRTRTPFELQDAFKQLSSTVGDINTQQLADSFNVLSDSLKDSPQHMKDALTGLSSLSKTVSSRDQQLKQLLANTSGVSKTLADRNAQLQRIISDGDLLLAELQSRKDAISALLKGTQQLSAQLSGLVADNRQQLKPTLEKLGKVTDVLQRNQDNLAHSLALMAPFARVGANATGNGRWFEGYLCGLLPPTITALGLHINPEGCTPPIAAPNQGVGGR